MVVIYHSTHIYCVPTVFQGTVLSAGHTAMGKTGGPSVLDLLFQRGESDNTKVNQIIKYYLRRF